MNIDRQTAMMILTAADCCESVYEPFESPGFAAWAQPFVSVETWKHGNAEGMGIVSNGIAYAVFRGTEPSQVKDWMTDLTARPSSFPRFGNSAYVHLGFEAYTLSLEREFLAFIEKHKDKRLVICGHSLGGSAAVLAASMISDKYASTVITFGGAPAGNNHFVTEYNRRLGSATMRFEHGIDIVPVLPDLLPWLEHVSDRLYLPICSKRIWDNPSQWKYRADRLLGWGRSLANIGSKLTPWNAALALARAGGGDHGMGRYTEHLKKALA